MAETWKEGDVLVSINGAQWRVGRPPENWPDFILVKRIWDERGPLLDVPAGHCYPPDHAIWSHFKLTQ